MNTIIVALITSLGVIANTIITKRVSNSEVLKRIKKLEKKIEDVEINQIKQYLIRAMSYMEKESIDFAYVYENPNTHLVICSICDETHSMPHTYMGLNQVCICGYDGNIDRI